MVKVGMRVLESEEVGVGEVNSDERVQFRRKREESCG